MTVEVNLYYSNSCGHCVRFKPEWEILKSKLDDFQINHNEYEAEANSNEIEQAKIEYFPTIRIKADDNEIDYMGPRTAPAILDYIGIMPDAVAEKNTAQSGGANGTNSDAEYESRYLKYKAKYLSLKKWAKENGY